MENQLLWFNNELESLPAAPARSDFDWPSRENRGSLTLTNKESGSRPASQRTSPFQTLNGLIGRLLPFSRRESSLNTLLEGRCSVTVIHNLISGSRFRESVQLGITYEVSGDSGTLRLLSGEDRFRLEAWVQMQTFFCSEGETESRPLAIYVDRGLEGLHMLVDGMKQRGKDKENVSWE